MARKEPREIKDVWIEYKKTRTEALRNILMENYLHLVRSWPSSGRAIAHPRILQSRYVPIGEPNDHFALIFRTIRHECLCRKGPVR